MKPLQFLANSVKHKLFAASENSTYDSEAMPGSEERMAIAKHGDTVRVHYICRLKTTSVKN